MSIFGIPKQIYPAADADVNSGGTFTRVFKVEPSDLTCIPETIKPPTTNLLLRTNTWGDDRTYKHIQEEIVKNKSIRKDLQNAGFSPKDINRKFVLDTQQCKILNFQENDPIVGLLSRDRGKTLGQYIRDFPQKEKIQVRGELYIPLDKALILDISILECFDALLDAGWYYGDDYHEGNVLVDPNTGRARLIDFEHAVKVDDEIQIKTCDMEVGNEIVGNKNREIFNDVYKFTNPPIWEAIRNEYCENIIPVLEQYLEDSETLKSNSALYSKSFRMNLKRRRPVK